jgi:hypothetical protein
MSENRLDKPVKEIVMPNYKGKHLYIEKGIYSHHGIGIENGYVIHYSGLANGIESGPICTVSIDTFSGGSEIKIKPHPSRKFTVDEAIERAKSRLYENAYSIWGNNCEHFVEWCIEGNHDSKQVDIGVTAGTGGTSAVAGAGAVGVVSSAGTVAGLSGSGVMSGLASVGGAVGGGAIAGAGLLAGAGGLGMATLINNTVLKDDENLSAKERDARQAGRAATYAGAAAGTAGGIAAISAAGTTAGLSAAGITSGLAAIGGTVGGGMAAGTAVVAAAPVAAAVAVGYGAYKVWKWLTD